MAYSTAIGSERVSRISGYRIKKGFFSETSGNLPQKLLIVGVANTANLPLVDYTKMEEIISSTEAGEKYGFGSPIHQAMKVLRPDGSDGVGGIPTFVLPLENAGVAMTRTLTITGAATSNGTHYVLVNSIAVPFEVINENTPTQIAAKISDAINGNINLPVSASAALGVVTLTSKYKGIISNGTETSISAPDGTIGLTYVFAAGTAGSGVSDLELLPAAIGNEWVTGLVNTENEDHFSTFEAINGIPYVDNPTGRYNPILFKPFLAFTGFKESSTSELTALANSLNNDNLTNVCVVVPGSLNSVAEIAASAARIFARTMQDSPERDINGMQLPELSGTSTPDSPMFVDYNTRDFLVKKGVSTVTLEEGKFIVQDFVTTYAKEGETPYQFSYARNINLDWNIKYRYSLLVDRVLKDKVLISDNQFTSSENAIKPKEWKATLAGLFSDLAVLALINDPDFSADSLRVEIDSINPNRFNCFFRYKRTGVARIVSTDVEAGF